MVRKQTNINMKTIGLIGGMSWESSAVYYKILNQQIKEKLGGHHSCKCVMYSVDFDEIARLQHQDKWQQLDALMTDAAARLERAGAEFIVLCTNTMHLCEPAIKQTIEIPFLHIAEATGSEIVKKGLKKVALLGTRFTMEKTFYSSVLEKQFGISVIIPDENDRAEVHRIIYDELVKGIISDKSKAIYQQIIARLQHAGAEGVILGCTEIPLLISAGDVEIPVFDTTAIHAEKAIEWALA